MLSTGWGWGADGFPGESEKPRIWALGSMLQGAQMSFHLEPHHSVPPAPHPPPPQDMPMGIAPWEAALAGVTAVSLASAISR